MHACAEKFLLIPCAEDFTHISTRLHVLGVGHVMYHLCLLASRAVNVPAYSG